MKFTFTVETSADMSCSDQCEWAGSMAYKLGDILAETKLTELRLSNGWVLGVLETELDPAQEPKSAKKKKRGGK